jgi:hypothetical protein
MASEEMDSGAGPARDQLLKIERIWQLAATSLPDPNAARCLAEAECLGIIDPLTERGTSIGLDIVS